MRRHCSLSIASVIAVGLLALALGCNPPSDSPDAAPTDAAASETAPETAPAGDGDDEVVARFGGQAIDRAALTAWIKEDLYEREFTQQGVGQRFEMEMGALERMIDEQLLEAEAGKAGLSVDALMEQAAKDVPPPDDAAIQAFYDQNQERIGQPLDAVKDRIAQYLTAESEQNAQYGYLAGLREAAGVEFALDPPRVNLDNSDVASKGPADAPITIVEFSDYQCPFCARAEPVVAEVLARYPEQVRFVFRHFPLDRIHPRARPAAEAAECAEEQGKFWEFHAKLFGGGGLEEPDLQRYAQELGLDADAFGSCVAERRFEATVQKDLEDGQQAGVSGTPAFFINGIPLAGARDADEFARWIDRELAAATP